MTKEEKDSKPAPLTDRQFVMLPFAEKVALLKDLDPKRKMDLIIADPNGRRLAAALSPQEFFRLVKDVGEEDALDLLQLASADQCVFLLDMETWRGWDFSVDAAFRWLSYMMEGGESAFHRLLKIIDFEFLLLFLSRELVVSGGIGDLAHDEERLAEYDFTFDDVFYLIFKNPNHSQMVGAFLRMLLDLDRPLYISLMESIKGSLDIELEEQCRRFRDGRLADLGFPPLEEALAIYARIDPASFTPQGEKEPAAPSDVKIPVPVSVRRDTLLFRALSLVTSDTVLEELNYLVNSALVAEGGALSEMDTASSVLERVHGYLNIALEHLSKGDEEKAARILEGEPLKRLFQFGFSVILELKKAAQKLQTAEHASGRALAGLTAKRPRYYRGLDPDGVDGYREFRDADDLKRVAKFLTDLKG